MKLHLMPIRGLPGQPETVLSVSGDVLTCDGTDYDLSAVPDGGQATPSGSTQPFVGPITRQNGELAATVLVVLGDDATADQPTDPAHWTITATSGSVAIPATRKEALPDV